MAKKGEEKRRGKWRYMEEGKWKGELKQEKGNVYGIQLRQIYVSTESY